VSNMLGQVKFATSLNSLCHQTGVNNRKDLARPTGVEVLIEIGPHSALAGPIKQIIQADAKLKERSILYMSALVRKKDATKTMVDLAANLKMKGFPIDLFAVNGFTSNKNVLADLPPYAWNKSTSHWAESRLSKAYRNRPHARTDLLGAPDFNSNAEIPWVQDHKIQSNVVYPAAGYIAMALEAIKQQALEKISEQQILGYKFREISIGQALIIPEQSDEVETMVTLKPHGEGMRVSSDL
jgi:acyl transferase domain-containing protein